MCSLCYLGNRKLSQMYFKHTILGARSEARREQSRDYQMGAGGSIKTSGWEYHPGFGGWERGNPAGHVGMTSSYLKEVEWLEIGLRTGVLNMGRH